MKILLSTVVVFLCSLTAKAEDDPHQEMLEKLFGDHEDLAGAQSAIEEAKGKKLPQQTLDEALFLYHIRSETEESLSKYIGQFESGIANYNPKEAVITQTIDEWRGLVTFCRAMEAANKSDLAEFKKQITEAFWLSPGNSEIFAGAIQKIRNREAMKNLVVDFDTAVLDTDGKPTSLAPHIKGRKAILIDFWARWCVSCMQLMPEMQVKADLLAKHGIAVVALNTEADPAAAAAVQKSENMKLPWLVEPDTEPFSKMFRVDSIPRVVLVSPKGKVLFNGHPSDPKLWAKLKEIAPELKEEKP